VALKRHRVKLRKSYVRHRFKTAAQTTWTWSRRLAFLVFGVWAAQSVNTFWVTSPQFRIKQVLLDPGAPATLTGRLGIKTGDHFWTFSAQGIAARLKSEFPELSDVRVSRRLDRGVHVTVKRRVPVGRVPDGENWLAMDEAGALFPLDATRVLPEKLVVLSGVPTGSAAKPYLDFLKRVKALNFTWAAQLHKVKTGTGAEATIFLKDETPVFWGDVREDERIFSQKAARLEAVLKNEDLKAGAEYIRFVNDYRLVVKPKNADERSAPESP
jgi:cell division septal protein FtsQ